MVDFLNQDLLEVSVDVIIQSNNCFCTQGTGIAKAIREKYPEVFTQDSLTKRGDANKLGTILPVKLVTSVAPYYCLLNYNQYKFGRNKRQVNYESFYRCLELSKDFCIKNGCKTLGLPYKMSCHNAGGSWPVVLCMIESVFNDENIKAYICKLPEIDPF
jgi:O-acetyl-ADP-ribose deacetylase (regulator of RNase III)